ncbi:hypothetical protein ACBQ65_15685 [Escherichia coli]
MTPLSPAAGAGRCRTAKPATRLLQRLARGAAARQSQRQDCCSGRVCHSRFWCAVSGLLL